MINKAYCILQYISGEARIKFVKYIKNINFLFVCHLTTNFNVRNAVEQVLTIRARVEIA